MSEQAVAGPEGVVVPPAVELTEVELLAQEILAARERKLTADISRPQKREIMSFGQVHDCDRNNFYQMAEGDQAVKWDAFVQARLDAGKARELAIKRELLDLGYEPMLSGEVLEIKDEHGKVLARGRTDLSLQSKSNFRSSVVVEVKCMNPMIWKTIKTWRDLLRNSWYRKYVRQLFLYMKAKKIDEALFLLDDFAGHWKILPVKIDAEFLADAVAKIERAAEAKKSGVAPERIPYSHDLCGMCNFQHICCPDIKQDPRIKVVDNATLANLLEQRDNNLESWRKVEKANTAIKKFFEGIKDGAFTIGNFIVTRVNQPRTSYEIPDDVKLKYAKKKDVFKNEIERYAKPDAETIFIGPTRRLSISEDEE